MKTAARLSGHIHPHTWNPPGKPLFKFVLLQGSLFVLVGLIRAEMRGEHLERCCAAPLIEDRIVAYPRTDYYGKDIGK